MGKLLKGFRPVTKPQSFRNVTKNVAGKTYRKSTRNIGRVGRVKRLTSLTDKYG